MKDPLVASRTFVTREQSQTESVDDFLTALKHIFKQACISYGSAYFDNSVAAISNWTASPNRAVIIVA